MRSVVKVFAETVYKSWWRNQQTITFRFTTEKRVYLEDTGRRSWKYES